MKDLETFARHALLHAAYGKFDLIAGIIPAEILQTGKPRRIKDWLIKNLQLNEQDINPNTLRSWLHRYRKSLRKNIDTREMQQWQDFEPTIVKENTIEQKLVIRKVTLQ